MFCAGSDYPHAVMSTASVIDAPPRLPLVNPSILAADFAHLERECRAALDAGADLLHLDVMDGHFVANLTMGPVVCRSLRRAFGDVCLDVHLMVQRPEMYIETFAEAGASHLTFHLEAVPEPIELAETVRAAGMTVGLAINPPTAVEAILPFVEAFDLILIMSVNPGFAGQSFIPEVLEKVRTVRTLLTPKQRLAMDGGINRDNAASCREAGCDVLVAATAVFGSDDYAEAIGALRGGRVSSVL